MVNSPHEPMLSHKSNTGSDNNSQEILRPAEEFHRYNCQGIGQSEDFHGIRQLFENEEFHAYNSQEYLGPTEQFSPVSAQTE
jgi:hypothetical protein